MSIFLRETEALIMIKMVFIYGVFISRSRTVLYVTTEWEPAFLRQAKEFLFFPLLPREASK